MESPFDPTADPAWCLAHDGFDKLREGSLQSRFAISNGLLGVRGGRATSRGDRWVVPARTYVAGLFDRVGAPDDPPGLVPAADWQKVRVMLPSGPLLHHPGEVKSHRMTLDMRCGALLSESHVLADGLAVRVRSLRLVSLSERALGLQLIRFEIDDGSVDITFQALFEGLDLGLLADRIEPDLGVWHTPHSGMTVAIATAASLQIDGRDLPPAATGPLQASWSWTTRPGQIVMFERQVAFVRSRRLDAQAGDQARQLLRDACGPGWRGVMTAHTTAWAARWACSDVAVDGDAEAQRALRFAIYHLNSAADPADELVSIGARALTGDDYHGHVFWDTEIFLLPFYVLTWPQAARALLMYRYHTLGQALAKAARMGWRGALYAWESAATGADVTPEHAVGPDRKIVDILCGKQEQHISADVAYAVWHYWQATADEEFLRDAGAEILLQTGRFWSSRARLEADGQHHIRSVIGPDEYHENIDDNAFTNVMARWNIRRALDVAALLQARWPDCWTALSARLGLDAAELKQWADVARTMATGLQPATGLFEQFDGYFALEDIDLADYAGRSVPMDLVLGQQRIAHSQVVKQADVVALLGLLPDEFAGQAGAANYDYYAPRCSHGSSLSHAMHGLAAARLGRREAALDHFKRAADIDLSDTHAAIDGGVHIAALGGVWMTAVLGFAGVSLTADGIALHPQLPAGWRRLGFALQWRGRHLRIRIDQDAKLVSAMLESGEPMTLAVSGAPRGLCRGEELRVNF